MGPTQGFSAVTDNVVRLHLFLDAHRNVSVENGGEPEYLWTATIRGPDRTRTICRYDLGQLIDILTEVDTDP